MPTDYVTNRTFLELFEEPARFEIPFFQRGYAWQKRQWDDLFNDLQEEVLADLDDGKEYQDIEHFFGPIVVQAQGRDEEDVRRFLVVDGQQRITTVYMLLGLIKHQLAGMQHLSNQAMDYVRRLHKLLVNEVSAGDDYRRMKVFSTKGDRLPTYRIIFGEDQVPKSPFYDTDVRLYRPGLSRVDEFRAFALKRLKADYRDVQSLWRLAEALLNCLKVVWIPLNEVRDDPQAIFESLNDKGMPLSASELLCSYLFKPLMVSGDFEELHNSKWLDAIQVLGNREKFEEFLRYQFSIGEKKMVGKGRKIYVQFKTKNRPLNSPMARQHLYDIHDGAKMYRMITEPFDHQHHDPEIRRSLQSISQTRMDSCSPFLLAVLKAHANKQLPEADARALLRETLVMLVRKKMTEESTTIYDTMFPNLFGRIAYEPDKIRAIHDEFRKAQVWVSNQEFEDALVKRGLYRTRDLAFTRMVLMEIDKKLHPHGQLPDYSTLQSIEHVMPQSLDQEWRQYLGDEARDEQLVSAIHTIGNLCLVSPVANSSLGQNPFQRKQGQLSGLTVLAQQFKEHPGPWGLDAIRLRSKELAAVALEVWMWGEQ